MKHNQIGWIRLYGRVYHTGKDVVAMATMTEPIEDDYQAASAEAERVPDTGTVPGHYRWFVNSARGDGYGSMLDRYRLAYGYVK